MFECYHCKQWIAEGEPHDCWTTTEAALTRDLSPDLREAWERLRETAVEYGDQRIYASHNSIMFSRKSCYFFRAPEEELPRGLYLPRPTAPPPARASQRTVVEVEVLQHHSGEASRPGRSPDD